MNKIELFNSFSYFEEEYLQDTMDANECSEDTAYEVANDMLYEDWSYIRKQIVYAINMNAVVVTGELGRWDGRHAIGEYFDDIENALDKILNSADDFSVDLEYGTLVVRTYDHDGSSIFYITMLSEEGKWFYEDWNYGAYDDNRTEEEMLNYVLVNHNKQIELNW